MTTALGARLTERFPVERLGRVMMICGLALAALTAVYGLVLRDLLRAWIATASPARLLITVLLVALRPTMGAMIPSVIRVLGASRSALVPWGWGINGATTVIAHRSPRSWQCMECSR